ncbi:hypothetical protein H0H93_015137 [Arthromyces matolae]|nr:hypothetical protein H0H93_015137 [Arthromyces matolae]
MNSDVAAQMTGLREEFDEVSDTLPGTQEHYAYYAAATAFEHSGLFNDRGREFPSYGYCTIIFFEFIKLFAAKALLIPQFEVECYTIKHDKTIKLTDSIASLPQNNVKGPVPDFAIVLLRAMLDSAKIPRELPCDLEGLKSWDEVKIYKMLIGVLTENKGHPTRSAATPADFLFDLRKKITPAMATLDNRAEVAFAGNDGTRELILIAWCGEWFCWRVIPRSTQAQKHREHLADDDNGQRSSISVGPQMNADVPRQFPRHPDTRRTQPTRDVNRAGVGSYNVTKLLKLTSRAKRVPFSNKKSNGPGAHKDPRRVRKANFRRWNPGEIKQGMETTLTDRQWQSLQPKTGSSLSFPQRIRKYVHQVTKPRAGWSQLIQFGTDESKEAWFLMYKILKEQITYLDSRECPGRQVVYEDSDEEMEPEPEPNRGEDDDEGQAHLWAGLDE